VKEFLKSANIRRSYDQKTKWLVFGTLCEQINRGMMGLENGEWPPRKTSVTESLFRVCLVKLAYSTSKCWKFPTIVSIFRPPDIVVDGLRFYRDSIYVLLLSVLFFSASYPPSSLNGTQPKPATFSEVSAI